MRTTDPPSDPPTTPGTSPENAKRAKGTSLGADDLNDTDWKILEALYESEAKSRQSRTTLGRLAETWTIGNHDSHHIKDSVKKLKRKGLVETLTGNKGGIWLTPVGAELHANRG
jgi:DNA-binding MarR family transcriptional regulator